MFRVMLPDPAATDPSSSPVAAILLASVERASQLAAALRGLPIEAIPVLGSDSFYRLINRRRLALAVVEHQLDGFLSGLEIVERMHATLARPPILLMAPSSAEIQNHARRLGIARLLNPETPLPAIVEAVKSVLTVSPAGGPFLPREARELAAAAPGAASLSPLLRKLIGWLGQGPTAAELAYHLSRDRKYAGELARMAGCERSEAVTDMTDAVGMLGPARASALLAASGLIDAQLPWLRALPASLCRWYHRRSLRTGCTAAAFYRLLTEAAHPTETGRTAPTLTGSHGRAGGTSLDAVPSFEAALIVGLIQDAGIPLLAWVHGQSYATLVDRFQTSGQFRLEAGEAQKWGLSHAEVTAALLQRWSLPDWLVRVTICHHQHAPQLAESLRPLLRAAQIGEAVANLADCRAPERTLRIRGLLEGLPITGCREALTEAESLLASVSRQLALPEPPPLPWLADEILGSISRPAGSCDADASSTGPISAPHTKEDPDDFTASRQALIAQVGFQHRLDTAAASPPALLVIDDDPQTVKMIELFLAGTSLSILECAEPLAARRLASQASAILCEAHLQQSSGAQLVRMLRRERSDVPILIVSRDGSRETVLNCLAAGVNDYLLKPLTKSLLLEKLRRHADLPPRNAGALNFTPIVVDAAITATFVQEAVARG